MVCFSWWCRPPRKPFKDKVCELYTCVFMCGCSFLMFLTFVFQLLLCFSSNLFFKLEMHSLTLIWTLKMKTSFCCSWMCVFLAKTAAVKSFAWFLSLSPLPTAASIHESPTRKKGARNLHQPSNACAFDIPLAENSLWASWSLLQICSCNLFNSFFIFLRSTVWLFNLETRQLFLFRVEERGGEFREFSAASVDMWKQFSPREDIYSSVEFPFWRLRWLFKSKHWPQFIQDVQHLF